MRSVRKLRGLQTTGRVQPLGFYQADRVVCWAAQGLANAASLAPSPQWPVIRALLRLDDLSGSRLTIASGGMGGITPSSLNTVPGGRDRAISLRTAPDGIGIERGACPGAARQENFSRDPNVLAAAAAAPHLRLIALGMAGVGVAHAARLVVGHDQPASVLRQFLRLSSACVRTLQSEIAPLPLRDRQRGARLLLQFMCMCMCMCMCM